LCSLHAGFHVLKSEVLSLGIFHSVDLVRSSTALLLQEAGVSPGIFNKFSKAEEDKSRDLFSRSRSSHERLFVVDHLGESVQLSSHLDGLGNEVVLSEDLYDVLNVQTSASLL